MTMGGPATVKTIEYLLEGVVARDLEAADFKPATVVGFSRDYRPRVRFFLASTGKWSAPKVVARERLGSLGRIEIEGPSQQHDVLAQALKALWSTSELGFRPRDLALLADEPSAEPVDLEEISEFKGGHAIMRRSPLVPRSRAQLDYDIAHALASYRGRW